MNLFNKLVLLVNFGLILATFGAYIAPYFHPESSALLAILGLGYTALLMGNICFIAYWLCLQPKWALASILTLVIGFKTVSGIIGFNMEQGEAIPSETLNIASFNMQFSKPVFRARAGAFKEYLSQFQTTDILGIQEHGPIGEKAIVEKLDFPYKHYSQGNFVAIFSKWPIINKGILDNFSENRANNCIWADILFHKDTIRIYNTHLEANQISGVVPGSVNRKTVEPPVNYSIAIGLLTYYQKFSSKRVTQAKRIQAHQQQSPYPSLLIGDMNDTPQSHIYQILSTGKIDTFRDKGQGLGATFGSTLKNKLACLRIDYIFADLHWAVLQHQIFPSPFSDHYLIQAEVQLNTPL